MGWIGNQRFQYKARRNAQHYTNTHSRYEKSRIVLEIIGTVLAWGGRFLCKPKQSVLELVNSCYENLLRYVGS